MNRNALLLGALLPLCACGGDDPAGAATGRDRPLVYTSFYPVHYFAERIAGESIDLRCALPRGKDPSSFVPTGLSVENLQEADLLVFNGAGFESWAERVSVPLSRIVETARPLQDRLIHLPDAVRHSHGTGSAHTHAGIDPHTWVDPRNASAQAEELMRGLLRVLPDEEKALGKGYRALAEDLQKLHEGFAALGALPEGEVLLGSHPSYNYLAARHGWAIVNVDLDPAVAATDADIAGVRDALGGKKARFVLWESPPVPELAERLRTELGLEGIVFSPCEALPRGSEPDYLTAMQANLERLKAAFTSDR